MMEERERLTENGEREARQTNNPETGHVENYIDTYSSPTGDSMNSPQLSNATPDAPISPVGPASPLHPESVRVLSRASPNLPLAGSPLFFDSQRSTPEGHVEASVAFNESVPLPQGRRMSRARQSIAEGIVDAPLPVSQDYESILEESTVRPLQSPERPSSQPTGRPPSRPSSRASSRASPTSSHQPGYVRLNRTSPVQMLQARPTSKEPSPYALQTRGNIPARSTPIPPALQPGHLDDSDSDEENPSKREYLFYKIESRNVELLSQGVQTKWSYLQDMAAQKTLPASKDLNEKLAATLDIELDEPTKLSLSTNFEGQEEASKKRRKSRSVKSPRVLSARSQRAEIQSRQLISSLLSNASDSDDSSIINPIDVALATNQMSSVGPPEILKYKRELKSADRQKILESAPSQEYMPSISLFSGVCQFCGKQIVTSPPPEQVNAEEVSDEWYRDQETIYCCVEYAHFLSLHLADAGPEVVEDEIIDIQPHAPFGSKAARKAAKERAIERMREREIEKQRAAAKEANLFSFSRQMKTIQYSLASPKCMEEGWTMKPRSPVPEVAPIEKDLFIVEVNSTALQKTEDLHERFYEDGRKLLTIFPDGTGCCYYPNGRPAVLILSTEKEKYTYIVQKNKEFDCYADPGILAVFEPNGNSVCHYKNQAIRIFMNADGGIELDKDGSRKKRWQWYFIKGHVHTPPFQPICFPLNKYLSVRLLDQDNIALIFTAHGRSVRFNVASKIKAMKGDGYGVFPAHESESYLSEMKNHISATLTKIHSALRLPKSSRMDGGTFSRGRERKKDLPPLPDSPSVVVN